jgi:hypothetical protein
MALQGHIYRLLKFLGLIMQKKYSRNGVDKHRCNFIGKISREWFYWESMLSLEKNIEMDL